MKYLLKPGSYDLEGYADKLLLVACKGERTYRVPALRWRGTIHFYEGDHVWIYKAGERDAPRIKRWFVSTYNGDMRARGRWPFYYLERVV